MVAGWWWCGKSDVRGTEEWPMAEVRSQRLVVASRRCVRVANRGYDSIDLIRQHEGPDLFVLHFLRYLAIDSIGYTTLTHPRQYP